MPVVTLYAGLRKIAGVNQTRLASDRLWGLLLALIERYPALEQAILDGRSLRPHIVITINGQPVDPAQSLDIALVPEDHIAIFPPIAGG